MGAEASKTKKLCWDEKTLSLLKGEGIDIGCGSDPVLPGVHPFDHQHGDANRVLDYVSKRYDFVFSSHALEHMHDPMQALRGWYGLLKPGGVMILLVPDEDLYEQGLYPSRFNPDHKVTFTLSKRVSWSPKSYNLIELVKGLGAELISAELQDLGLDRSLLRHAPSPFQLRLGRIFMKLRKKWPGAQGGLLTLCRLLGAAIDQTALDDDRLAQIQVILQKPLNGDA